MKKIFTILSVVCLIRVGQAQSDSAFRKIIAVDSETAIAFDRVNLSLPPTNPEFLIIDDVFVEKLLNAFNYWDMDMEKRFYPMTLYLISKNNSIDSSIVIEGEGNSFLYGKKDASWKLKNFTIKGTNISLRNISCGLTSKQVFKMLSKKIKRQVGDGTIWISDKENKHHFVFTFAKDLLISMQF